MARKRDVGMNIFRSEPMEYVQFVFPREAAYESTRQLGNAGIVHFVDLNPSVNPSKREFSGEIKKCNELRRYLRFFRLELGKQNLKSRPPNPTSVMFSITDLETKFEEHEKNLKQLDSNEEEMKKHQAELIEMKHVLILGNDIIKESTSEATYSMTSADSSSYNAETGSTLYNSLRGQKTTSGGYADLPTSAPSQPHTGMKNIAGIISQSKLDLFHRMTYVALRGNVFFQSRLVEVPVIDPITKVADTKYVFILFFSGEHANERLMKICSSFGASVYAFPENDEKLNSDLHAIEERLNMMENVLTKSHEQRMQQLLQIEENLTEWSLFVGRERALYTTLNLFSADAGANCLIGEGWVAKRNLDALHERLSTASSSSHSSVASLAHILKVSKKKMPPTHIRTSKFTNAQQEMINAFGTATYREVNPGLITLVTFPFLFSLMFGDFGHGIIMAIFGLCLCIFEKKLEKMSNDIVDFMYVGRYLILCMGIMATITGFLYNECFSLSLNFGSGFTCEKVTNPETNATRSECTKVFTYGLGVDPLWRQCDNYLTTSNSMKMKMSILIGVAHMVFGIFFSLLNYLSVGSILNVVTQFLPQIIMMLSLFGYLCFLIVYKWMTPFDDAHPKPMLIRTMINMFLSFNKPIEPKEQLFEGEKPVEVIMVVLFVGCIVWLLLPKPIYLWLKHRRQRKVGEDHGGVGYEHSGTYHSNGPSTSVQAAVASGGTQWGINGDQENLGSDFGHHTSKSALPSAAQAGYSSVTSPTPDYYSNLSGSQSLAPSAEEDEEEEFSMGEIFVHQLIETIEFTLGCISNTASYLRLWALSLAHGELADVFFSYTMILIPKMAPVIGSAVGVAVWLGATFGILMCMEGLSAFLHCLRLHWVELMNKFYKAEGYEFIPLSFRAIDKLSVTEEDAGSTRTGSTE